MPLLVFASSHQIEIFLMLQTLRREFFMSQRQYMIRHNQQTEQEKSRTGKTTPDGSQIKLKGNARQTNLVSSIAITHKNAVTLSRREFQPNIFLNPKCSALFIFSLVKSCDNYLSSLSSGIKARVMLICF